MASSAPARKRAMPRERGRVGFDLPEEVTVEILSWLPAKDLLRFRSVCKRWRDLTSTRYFTRLYQQRCPPMLLYEQLSLESGDYLCDQWWAAPPGTKGKGKCDDSDFDPTQYTRDGHYRTSYKVGKGSCDNDLRFSNGGLIVKKHCNRPLYTIINPVYHENIKITLSKELWDSDMCGVFFHPLLNQYCTLLEMTVLGESTKGRKEYRILTLGSKPCWRVISNPRSHRARTTWIPPILINDQLYWTVVPETGGTTAFDLHPDIMEFDIRNEEFTLIPSPANGTYKCNYSSINLLDIGGLLSLVCTRPLKSKKPKFEVKPEFEVTIWTLKDRDKQVWTVSSYTIKTDSSFEYVGSNFQYAIALVNDELLVYNSGGMYACNLKLCTVRRLENDSNYCGSSRSHVMNLVSLRNCKSEIYMDNKGELEQNI